MDAIITAGGIPKEGEPLYPYTQGSPKALLDVAGKPMIQWVVDALNGASSVEHIVIMGLAPENGLVSNKPVYYLPNQGNMLSNIIGGAQKLIEVNPTTDIMLIVSSDIPTLTPQAVDWLAHEVEKAEVDIYYTVVGREMMESRFPGSKRTYTKLKDIELCGGDMNAFRAHLITTNKGDMLRSLIEARKNVLKQASIIGFGTLLLLLFRQITLDNLAQRAAKALKVTARALISPHAELGMDIDKPHQLEMLSADLSRRTARG